MIAIVLSPVNLHAVDQFGRHVGLNESGGIEIEIPEAKYSGPDAHPQWIKVFNNSLNVTFYTTGVEDGTFDMIIKDRDFFKTNSNNFTSIPTSNTTKTYVFPGETDTLYIDSDGDNNTDEVLKAPLASFNVSFDCKSQTFTFNASSSFDPDGNISSYEWDFGDGNVSNMSTVNHSYSNIGNYKVRLTVEDDDGMKSSKIRVIDVGPSCGDVNCDGTRDISDVIKLLYHVGYPGQYSLCNEWAGDINGDNTRDISDVIRLLYYVGYPGEYELECKC